MILRRAVAAFSGPSHFGGSSARGRRDRNKKYTYYSYECILNSFNIVCDGFLAAFPVQLGWLSPDNNIID